MSSPGTSTNIPDHTSSANNATLHSEELLSDIEKELKELEGLCLSLLPQLQELILEYARFAPGEAKKLLSILKRRRERGLGLAKIAFPRVLAIDREREILMPSLQKIVPTVIWEPQVPKHMTGQYSALQLG